MPSWTVSTSANFLPVRCASTPTTSSISPAGSNRNIDGLRSCEVLALELEDVQLADGQMRVRGKGNKKRLVPLPPDILEVLGHYLRHERPLTNSPALFISLKGRQRGRPVTAAGLRSLF